MAIFYKKEVIGSIKIIQVRKDLLPFHLRKNTHQHRFNPFGIPNSFPTISTIPTLSILSVSRRNSLNLSLDITQVFKTISAFESTPAILRQ